MASLSGCRWLLALIAVLAAGLLVVHLVFLTQLAVQPAPAASTHTASVAFAAGVGSTAPRRGPSNYQSHCASCHGTGGKGDGWTAWLYRLKMRDLTDAAYVQTLRDDYIFQVIKHGGASLGKPGMPSWSQELDDREIRDLVVHIRSLAAPPQQPQATGSSR